MTTTLCAATAVLAYAQFRNLFLNTKIKICFKTVSLLP